MKRWQLNALGVLSLLSAATAIIVPIYMPNAFGVGAFVVATSLCLGLVFLIDRWKKK